ncbi:MAG: hypothetical protein H6733_03465 [Alphaproteobacteria bacterium]|nr:hypothetical protein [Alphaproteobacteria bacterium]
MRPLVVLLGLVLAACEPPPNPLGSGVSLDIIYPPATNPGGGAFQILPETDGDYHIDVIVDIEGIELVNPYTDPPPPVDDTQGHWHLETAGQSHVTSFDRWAELVVDGSTITSNSIIVLTATMRQNDHNPREVEGTAIEDTIEVQLVAP